MLTMRWELCGSTFVIVHGPNAPLAEEYDATLRGYATHLGRFRGILICSEGGAPNPTQRRQTTDFWQGKELPKTVIMTASAFARGVITALNWFFPQQLTAVKEGDFEAAFECLEVPTLERVHLERTVTRLRNELREYPSYASRV